MKKILLQVPEGMKRKVLEIADKLGDVYIDGEARFGACDLAISEAKALGVDKIVHFGHRKFMNTDFPVEYVEVREEYDPTKVLKKDIGKLKGFKRIHLFSSVQFLDSLRTAKEFLEKNNKIVEIVKENILGCDSIPAKILEKKADCFLFIGTGIFHPLGLALNTNKPVFSLSIEKNEIINMENVKEKYIKQKYVAIALARHAKRFGILVSTKPGQMKVKIAEEIKKKLEKKGKKAYIIVFNEIRPEKLEGMDLDCYVNTACPRISIDDRTNYKKPMIGIDELMSFI
jgi:2-(3-amino-3-carboxypropyl)histidine synthase